jgi:glutaredoxin 3
MRAKQLLQAKGVDYNEIPVDGDHAMRRKLAAETGSSTVPQIWIGDHYVGGCNELYALEHAGKLDTLLNSN